MYMQSAPLRIFSDGSGLNSMAALVLQARGIIRYDYFVFANVGEDSENKQALAYRRDVLEPYAAQHGIPLVERWRLINGERVTLREHVLDPGNRSIAVPIMMPGGAGFGNRTCTDLWKVQVVSKWIKDEMGAQWAVIALGYTIDEGRRVWKKYPNWHDHNLTRQSDGGWRQGKALGYWRLYEFPLVEQQMSRAACAAVVESEGLPPVPPSACTWCPFTPRGRWIERKLAGDSDYDDGIVFQNAVNEKFNRLHADDGKGGFVAIHSDGIRLEDVPDQYSLWDTVMDEGEAGCGLTECGL